MISELDDDWRPEFTTSLVQYDTPELGSSDNKMLHVVYRVGDMDKTIKFYQDVFGMEVGADLAMHMRIGGGRGGEGGLVSVVVDCLCDLRCIGRATVHESFCYCTGVRTYFERDYFIWRTEILRGGKSPLIGRSISVRPFQLYVFRFQ